MQQTRLSPSQVCQDTGSGVQTAGQPTDLDGLCLLDQGVCLVRQHKAAVSNAPWVDRPLFGQYLKVRIGPVAAGQPANIQDWPAA